jgi:hypothetical protein
MWIRRIDRGILKMGLQSYNLHSRVMIKRTASDEKAVIIILYVSLMVVCLIIPEYDLNITINSV